MMLESKEKLKLMKPCLLFPHTGNITDRNFETRLGVLENALENGLGALENTFKNGLGALENALKNIADDLLQVKTALQIARAESEYSDITCSRLSSNSLSVIYSCCNRLDLVEHTLEKQCHWLHLLTGFSNALCRPCRYEKY
jgi:hypothetical protein